MKITAQKNRITNYESRITNLFIYYSKFITHNSLFKTPGAGFTLVEVLVATTILVTLAAGVFLSLNPIAQINKSQDSQKMADIQAVKTALDLYYNDTKCYPKAADGVAFGGEWRVNNTVYMKKVPQDPNCKSDGSGMCYRYRTVTDPTDPTINCPQWNVVFAQLSKASTLTSTCALSSLSNCAPSDYPAGKFACTMSGGVNCDSLSSSSIGGGSVETILPTPTPNPCEASSNRALGCACSNDPQCASNYCDVPVGVHQGTNQCKALVDKYDPNDVKFPLPVDTNPDPYELVVNPLHPLPGTTQTFKLKVADPGVLITKVEVVVTSDREADRANVPLSAPVGQVNNAGTWTGTRGVGNQETFCNLYAMEFYITAGTPPNQIVGHEGLGLAATGVGGVCP